MTDRDIFALVISYVFAFALLGVAEALRLLLKVRADYTRKLVHIGAGMWVWGEYFLFDTWWAAMIPFASFIVLNYISYRTRLVRSVETGEGAGTVYFALSVTLLTILWPLGLAYAAIGGVMAMTWGDAAAALVGRAFGRHRYLVYRAAIGSLRSLEGSLAMFVLSFVSIGVTLLLFAASYSVNSLLTITGFALLAAICASIIEAVTPFGLDNISVPILTAGILVLLGDGRLDPWRLAGGLALSTLIAAVAYALKTLNEGGTLGAVVTGTCIFAFGGWTWGLLLIAFFITSSLLSRYRARDKRSLEAEKFDKGSKRDMAQALANGGVGALLALAHLLWPYPWLLAAFVAAMATVNADTWATELGVLSKRPPHLITSSKPVAVGTSGGITALGTGASAAGALLIGAIAALLLGGRALLGQAAEISAIQTIALLAVALLGGVAGALFDSLLGATLQVIYYSPTRQKETEKQIDPDGTPNQYQRGLRWLNNDVVNLLSSLFGAAVGATVFLLF